MALLEAGRNYINFDQSDNSGDLIDVALIDSVYRLPQIFEDEFDILYRKDVLEAGKDRTHGHGVQIFDILSQLASYSTFHLYQAVNEDREIELTVFSDAIKAALDNHADIINISAGRPRPGCDGIRRKCGFCDTIQQAMQRQDVTFVTAAGNSPSPDDRIIVNCPAFCQPAIGVGGFVVKCEYSLNPSETETHDYSLRPPHALWAKTWDEFDYPEHALTGNYCSGYDCGPAGACKNFQSFQEWDYNPNPDREKPDVLAPIHYWESAIEVDGNHVPYILGGSSYAAPFVSGVIAHHLSILLDSGKSPSPYQIREAVKLTSRGSTTDTPGFFDAQATFDYLI